MVNARQEARLDALLEAFKAESEEGRSLSTPRDGEGKRRLLRALMNVRMPGSMAPEVLKLQDDYLKERAREMGVVALADIPTVKQAYGSQAPFADRLSLWRGDITRLAVDAIVNAANSQMLGCFVPLHACIDNCIHTYAGVQLRAECQQRMEALRRLHGFDYEQPTAVPMLTDAYNLPSQRVVHVVGPIVEGALTPRLEGQLADCYRNTLTLCAKHGLRSVAFCCISTGVFRFPNDRAADIAVRTVNEWLAGHPRDMDRVIFNVFREADLRLYEERLIRGF